MPVEAEVFHLVAIVFGVCSALTLPHLVIETYSPTTLHACKVIPVDTMVYIEQARRLQRCMERRSITVRSVLCPPPRSLVRVSAACLRCLSAVCSVS